MTTINKSDATNSPKWKKPDEVMALHRLKRKKRALQERMKQPSHSCPNLNKVFNKETKFNFSRILGTEKRKNPFSKNYAEKDDKIFCKDDKDCTVLDESADSTLFTLLGLSNKNTGAEGSSETNAPMSFTNILNNINKQQTEQQHQIVECNDKKYLPVDWTLKTKIRLMSPKPFAWNQKLKASEEASGITGFVRCLDTSNSSTLDTSHHARFHQNCLYWQHPVLPWMSLFPRTMGRVSKNNIIATNEEMKDALHKEWTESFRSLFQLVRTRQCPYFYVCANTFTCLFRAAGIGGVVETCAFLTPTTRGLRQTLKQEEIEFTMPLKRNNKRKSTDNEKTPKNNTSADSCYDTMDDNTASTKDSPDADNCDNNEDDSADEDDMESEEWLQSLGVAADEIKKINNAHMRLKQTTESSVDNSTESLVCIQGVDAQALFNFLLNCKSCTPLTGTFGGIPPTLLSPTAFQGGTLQALKVRESVVHSEDGKYYSIELRGPVLPTTIHSLCSLLQSNSNSFSATFANMQQTIPFSKAAQLNIEDEKSKENPPNNIPTVFNQENLSDCGLNSELLQMFCSSNPSVMETLDSLRFCHEKKAYTW